MIANRRCACPTRDADSFLVNAIREASDSLMGRPGVLATIRNGGWEHAFRNSVLEATEQRFPHVVGFTEARVGPVSRIDLAYVCRDCRQCFLVAETKANFMTQPRDMRDRRLDACLQLEPLARFGLPAYLVYVVVEQAWCGEQSALVDVHNASISDSCAYKRFIQSRPTDVPHEDMFPPNWAVMTRERCFAANRVRVSVHVWLARYALVEGTQNVSLTFINGDVETGEPCIVTAQELALRREHRMRRRSRTAPDRSA